MIKKIKINNLFLTFLFIHLLIWTFIPFFSNVNLPLDTIEALAWGSNLDWGFSKHPPMSAVLVEIFYKIFKNNDWAFYLLSQLCVITAFYYTWLLSKKILKNKILSLISIMLLEGIFFYNFTTPEFNVNVCQLPFWSATTYYAWSCYSKGKMKNWILLGLSMSLGFLSKYIFVLLIISIKIFFLYEIFKKNKIYFNYFVPILIFTIILIPHIFWLIDNNFVSVLYAFKRSGLDENHLINHLLNPLVFLMKQLILLIPFMIMVIILTNFKNINFKIKDKKLFFLFLTTLIPICLIFVISLISGAKIRTMWMTPFYLSAGLLIIYILKNSLKKNFLNRFIFVFLFFFILSPSLYFYISVTDNTKRTDYPGKEISELVQRKWDNNFYNEINVVIGDEWSAGNLSYHLKSRPKWINSLNNNLNQLNKEDGVIYTGNPKILKKICPGIFGSIKPVGYCMIGIK